MKLLLEARKALYIPSKLRDKKLTPKKIVMKKSIIPLGTFVLLLVKSHGKCVHYVKIDACPKIKQVYKFT